MPRLNASQMETVIFAKERAEYSKKKKRPASHYYTLTLEQLLRTGEYTLHNFA